MQRTQILNVKDLAIDLENFRTITQKDESDAIKAMMSISPDYFWGLMDSLIDDGYLPTENIIVLQDKNGRNCVKEGNRRVASLKIMLGLIDKKYFDLPANIVNRIKSLPKKWLDQNSAIPCAVYTESEGDVVDRIVSHTHGKGQKSGRDIWETVARARHNKIKNKASEPGLDLLEKYLNLGTNITQEQRLKWAGRYNLTILDEVIKKLAPRLGEKSGPQLAKKYPNILHKKSLDEIIHAIGMESLTFPVIRDSSDFALKFGIPPSTEIAGDASDTSNKSDLPQGDAGNNKNTDIENKNDSPSIEGKRKQSNAAPSQGDDETPKNPKKPTLATNDERMVRKLLRGLKLHGENRAKIETIKKEMSKLKLDNNPIAFCFLLRSMFEISAKAYCQDHSNDPNGPKSLKSGAERPLADILRDIVNHLTQNKADKQMVKLLHGPLTEIQRSDGILSLTSMNQLVHNPSFTIAPSDIPTLFSNIFPLLEQINR